MKNAIHIIVIAAILALPAAVMAQDAKKDKKQAAEQLDLDRIADDLKFQNGMQLYTLKQYGKAVEVLNEYLEIFNDGTHRHEAYKLIGDVYFGKYDYQRAIRVYRKLYEEYSTTEDGIAAYYQIGICYTKMGFENKAQEVFQEILEDYPESAFSGQARTQLDLLNLMN